MRVQTVLFHLGLVIPGGIQNWGGGYSALTHRVVARGKVMVLRWRTVEVYTRRDVILHRPWPLSYAEREGLLGKPRIMVRDQ
jgi:hypothetical protein